MGKYENFKAASLKMAIRFGTSGWRAIIADEFTFSNVEKVLNSICSYLKTKEHLAEKPLIIGQDSRFMGEIFTLFASEFAKRKGFNVLRCTGPTPTPTISQAILHQNAAGAINFTASHNPPEYQGMKFSTSDGAPALPEVTKELESNIDGLVKAEDTPGGSITDLDPCDSYLNDLRSKINFDAIAKANGKFVYDPLWGTGRGYLDKILVDHGVNVKTIHDWRDVTFGGRSPEPSEDHLEELRKLVLSEKLTLGIATDGDSDRFGLIDSNGAFITANELITLLADYLAESRNWNQGLARSVATSNMIDRVAKYRGIKLYETPVGFKYIGELINKGEIYLGGEESAGLSIFGHFPEKDGILACLLAIEAVAVRGASLTEQLEELYKKIGKLESGRIGVKLDGEIAAKLKEKLSLDPSEIGGKKIDSVIRIDGVKFLFSDKSWMLMRPSGTEPLVRIYAESESRSDTETLLKIGRDYLLN